VTLPSKYQKLVAIDFSRNFRSVARIVETPLAQPGPFEVTVKNRYAGVNASDVNISGGVYLAGEVPFDLGVEAIGHVVAKGDNVSHLHVGQPVLTFSPGGGYREYQTVSSMMAIPVPDASKEVLTLGLSALTAAVGLIEVGEMRKGGETVLVTAAAGATGSYAVQLAKAAGNHVIGTCGGSEKAKLVKELGCDRVVDYRVESLDEVLTKEYPRGVSLVYEGVGKEMFDTGVKHLAIKGRLLVVGYISEYDAGAQPVLLPRVYEKLLWKSAQIRGFVLSHYADKMGPHLFALIEKLKKGELRALVDSTDYVGLESVCDAVEALHAGKNTGKVVIQYQ